MAPKPSQPLGDTSDPPVVVPDPNTDALAKPKTLGDTSDPPVVVPDPNGN